MGTIESRLGFPLPVLHRDLWITSDDMIATEQVGHVTRYDEDGEGLTLRSTTRQLKRGMVTFKEVPGVIDTAAVGYSQNHFFLAAAPTRVNVGRFEERFLQYVRGIVKKVTEMGRLTVTQEVKDKMRSKVTLAISMRGLTPPTHLLILNVPYEVRFSRQGATAHALAAAALQPYVLLRNNVGDTNDSIGAIEMLDTGSSFGVIVECKHDEKGHPQRPPTHFVVNEAGGRGEARPYWCQLLTAGQGQLLQSKNKKMVMVFRGCAKIDSVDDTLRRAVAHYLATKKIQRCLAVVEQVSHNIEGTKVKEAVIAVYTDKPDLVSEVRAAMGFGRASDIRVEVRGLIFQVITDLQEMKGKRMPAWVRHHKRHATISNIDTTAEERVVATAIMDTFGVDQVDYWVTRRTAKGGKVVSVGLADGFEAGALNPEPLHAIMVNAEIRQFLDIGKPIPRRDDTHVLYRTRDDLVSVSGSGSSTSSVTDRSRSASGRFSTPQRGRAQPGRTTRRSNEPSGYTT
jgi:hypothetical protein